MDQTAPETSPRRVPSLIAALLLIATACNFGSDASIPDMTLRVIEGSASILRGEETIPVSSQASVEVGDAISSQGLAELGLVGGVSFELVDARLTIASTDSIELRSGDLLATFERRGEVETSEASVSGETAVFRVDRGLALRLGVYDGSATITGSGNELEVPRYREAIVAGGVIPEVPKPYQIDPDDRWDRTLLERAIELDERLRSFGSGLEAQLGPVVGNAFFSLLLPEDETGFLAPYEDIRRSDILIGLMMAAEASAGSPNIAARFGNILDLWRQGASWGLLALEFGASAEGLFDGLLSAIERVGLFIQGLTPGGTANQPGQSGPSPSPTTSPNGGGGGGGNGPGKPSPSPSPSPSPTGPTDDIDDTVDDTQDDVECAISGLLGDPCPS